MNPYHKSSSTQGKETPTDELVFDPMKMNFNDFIAKNAVMFLPGLNQKMLTMGGLKLDLLPPLAKEFFIRWIFEVNRPRLTQGLPLLVTYGIIKQCPLWKIIPMPYRNIKLTKDSIYALNKMIPPEKRLKFHGIQ
jgi:hypothetical protein